MLPWENVKVNGLLQIVGTRSDRVPWQIWKTNSEKPVEGHIETYVVDKQCLAMRVSRQHGHIDFFLQITHVEMHNGHLIGGFPVCDVHDQ